MNIVYMLYDTTNSTVFFSGDSRKIINQKGEVVDEILLVNNTSIINITERKVSQINCNVG